ncbi:UNVERIFIED_CONTAM: hypothetical protein NCL1_50478 [Trichonephila clavipes]
MIPNLNTSRFTSRVGWKAPKKPKWSFIVTETTDKFRWPVIQTRRPCQPPPDRLSVEGPLQTPPPKPRLRYHKQSSYVDTFIEEPLTTVKAPAIESTWSDPVGKYGDFIGESTYERQFQWPSKIQLPKVYVPPHLKSTIGMAIIPLLGTGDREDIMEDQTKEKQPETMRDEVKDNAVACERMKNPSYWVLNCNPNKPTQKIWEEQTSHRIDYPPKGLKHSSKANRHKSNVKFTGKMETISSGMRDYPNIQPVVSNRTFFKMP